MADQSKYQNKLEKKFLSAQEVSEILGVSLSTSYRIIRRLNEKLSSAGKITIPGKISSKFFYENIYS